MNGASSTLNFGKKQPRPFALTPERDLKTLVENRTVFNFKNCELNIFETHRHAEQVFLKFQNPVFTTMLRGKKVMHLPDAAPFDYLPGESVVLPESEPMVIDFPLASFSTPAQCVALEIDKKKIQDTLARLNENHRRVEENGDWRFENSQFHIHNSDELTDAVNRLIRLPVEKNLFIKDELADIAVQELLVRLMQTQIYTLLTENTAQLQSSNRFAFIIQFIRLNLSENLCISKLASLACMSEPHFFRSFKRELGLSPADFIIRERIKFAKKLLVEPSVSISEVCYRSGFNNLAYFTLRFKKSEGMTPSLFKRLPGPSEPKVLQKA